MMQAQIHALPTLLRLPDVLERIKVSKATIYRWGQTGQFPRPYRLTPTGSTVAWSAAEVDAWVASKLAANDGTFDGILNYEAKQTA